MYVYYVDPRVREVLLSHCQQQSPSTQDIYGGRKYRELKEFTSRGNLTLVVNTDGIQLFKSSTVSMWPIWIVINELPVSLR